MLEPGNCAQHRAGAIPLAVVTRHEAWVVISDNLRGRGFRTQPPRADKLGEKFSFVDDFIIAPTEVGIFLLQIVIAMRTLRASRPRGPRFRKKD